MMSSRGCIVTLLCSGRVRAVGEPQGTCQAEALPQPGQESVLAGEWIVPARVGARLQSLSATAEEIRTVRDSFLR